MSNSIKSMQLYPRPERIWADLAADRQPKDGPLDVAAVNKFDQLHYHGTDALDVAIAKTGMTAGSKVLEVGSGWGGCARYLAHKTAAHVTAVELQSDYNAVAQTLTDRCGLAEKLDHQNADFLEIPLPPAGFDHAVSWLALFHIPDRPRYLAKIHASLRPGGSLLAEDLYLIKSPEAEELEDFQAHLFPNSLVLKPDYLQTLQDAGFNDITAEDMTDDWANFTATRLAAFHANAATYKSIHSTQAYEIIETFYNNMAGYFERGLVGGIRVHAKA